MPKKTQGGMNVAPRSEGILSLFSGIGGLDLGVADALRRLGRTPRTVCYVEGEAFAAACLAAQMEASRLDDAPIWSDVRTFDARPWRGLVSGILAGFPCQDISNSGRRAGLEGERSGLFFEVLRIAGEVDAKWLFLENVAALVGRGLDTVLGALSDAGWDAEWMCIRATEVGATNRRDRWFCLAHRDGSGLEGWGEPVAESEDQRSSGTRRASMGSVPPDPEDLRAWRDVLSRRPDLAPALESPVRGMGPGLPDRVDRLRALGNSVIGACAEQAFLDLQGRLNGMSKETSGQGLRPGDQMSFV